MNKLSPSSEKVVLANWIILLLTFLHVISIQKIKTQTIAKYTVSNIAGYSDLFGNGGEAIDASLKNPHDMFFSPSRNTLYFTDTHLNAIRMVSLSDRKISIFQNDDNSLPFEYNGITGSETLIYYTIKNAVYFTNIQFYSFSNLIAGKSLGGFGGDGGNSRNALLNNPTCVFYSNTDDSLYICDTGNHRIRKVSNSDIITTIAGNGANAFSGDGNIALNASLSYPQGIYVSQIGEIYIADTGNHRIRKIFTNGTIVTIAGNGNVGFNGDSLGALETSLNNPIKLWMNRLENELFITDMANNRIRKLSNNGIITTFAGGGIDDSNSIPATQAQLYEPRSMILNSLTDEWFILESKADRISIISQSGVISRFCGSLVEPLYNSNPFLIQLGKIYGITKLENVTYFSQSHSHKILLEKDSQMQSQSLGSGIAGFSGDGLVVDSNTQFNFPTSITFSPRTKAIYIADTYNQRVRRIDPLTKVITTIAGTGIPGYNGDGILATNAQLNNPISVSVWYNEISGSDVVYIADKYNQKVRRILPNGIIQTVIGTIRPGKSEETLWNPNSVSVHNNGEVYTADTGNKRILKTTIGDSTTVLFVYDSNYSIQTLVALNDFLYFAGTRSAVFSYHFALMSVISASTFNNPQALGFSDNSTDVLVADTYGYTIQTFSGAITPNTRRIIGNYRPNQDGTLATRIKSRFINSLSFLNDELYYVDNVSIYKIKRDGNIEWIAGSTSESQQNIETFYSSSFGFISDMHASNGFLYLSDSKAGRIWKIDPLNKTISRFAGTTASNFIDSENVDAKTVAIIPWKLTSDSEYVYYYDNNHSKIKKISLSNGNMTTVAGGVSGNPINTPRADLNTGIYVENIVVSPLKKQIYVVERSPHYLKTISGNSIILLGNPRNPGLAITPDDSIFVGGIKVVNRFNSGDGTFTNITSPIFKKDPVSMTTSTNGEIYVSDSLNIYKLTPYCDNGYFLNISFCLPICFGASGSSACGGSLQGSCISPDTCQCNSTWGGPQCLISIASSVQTSNSTINNGGLKTNNNQIVLIAVLVSVFVALFIVVVLVVVIVAIVITYLKLKKKGSNVGNISNINSPDKFEMNDVNASTFDQISDFPTDDSYFKPLSGSMSSITNSEAVFDPLSRYKDLTKIGQGAFGSVFKAFDNKTNKTKALKIIKFKSFGELNSIMKEGMQLMNINHPNILKVNDLFVDKQEILCMDMEFYEKGDLCRFINSKDICSEVIIKQIVYQMCSALDFVHSNLKAIHRDVKPSNIFIKSLDDSSIHIILADFGLAKDSQASIANQSYAGTPLYMSPELGLGASYGSNTDIYSLGVTVYQLMTKDNTTAISHLYLSKDEKQAIETLRNKMMQSSNYSEELVSICLRMLTKDASNRPSAKEILKYPYFQ